MQATASTTSDRFPSAFWIINAVELLERLAYYGALSVTALFFLSLGFTESQVGLLFAFYLPMPYLVSLLAGPLAEKFGYKQTVLAALVFYGASYAVLALASQQATVGLAWLVAAIALLGLGAGTFKPLPAATVAHTTSEARRNLGYTIYYWAINVGAFVGPVLIAFWFLDRARADPAGRLLPSGYTPAFLFAALVIALAFVLTFLAFRNPHPRDRSASVGAALRRLGPGFRDLRFVVLLAIYSGFWFVYAMNFTFVTPYLRDHVRLPSWFPPNLQQAINPLVIILLGVPIGKLVEKVPPLRMMNLGILLFTLGFLLIGFNRALPLFVLGMVVATIGEVLTQPGFLSLVSRIAPKDRVAVYQGMAFLPIAVGFMLGPLVGGALYERLVTRDARPTFFWATICCVALLTLALFILYTRWTAGPTTARPARARGRAPLAYAAIALLFIPLVLGLGRSAPVARTMEEPLPDVEFTVGPLRGEALEGRVERPHVALPAGARGDLLVVLTWTDEPAAAVAPEAPNLRVNQPDRFDLIVRDARGSELANAGGSNGADGRGELRLRVPATAGDLRIEFWLTAGDVTAPGSDRALERDERAPWSLVVHGLRAQED